MFGVAYDLRNTTYDLYVMWSSGGQGKENTPAKVKNALFPSTC
jgi:hypothetical protein